MADWRYQEAKAAREALERIADALERIAPPEDSKPEEPKKERAKIYPKRLN